MAKKQCPNTFCANGKKHQFLSRQKGMDKKKVKFLAVWSDFGPR